MTPFRILSRAPELCRPTTGPRDIIRASASPSPPSRCASALPRTGELRRQKRTSATKFAATKCDENCCADSPQRKSVSFNTIQRPHAAHPQHRADLCRQKRVFTTKFPAQHHPPNSPTHTHSLPSIFTAHCPLSLPLRPWRRVVLNPLASLAVPPTSALRQRIRRPQHLQPEIFPNRAKPPSSAPKDWGPCLDVENPSNQPPPRPYNLELDHGVPRNQRRSPNPPPFLAASPVPLAVYLQGKKPAEILLPSL
jgi:hypothetical protein